MKLVKPHLSFKDQYLSAVKETRETDHFNLHMLVKHTSMKEASADFGAYVQKLLSFENGENLPEGYVPDSIYWLIDDNEFIGQVSIRHMLTPYLEKLGGHIGYFIRPSMRKKGYGTQILKLALPKAFQLGIKKVLVTCNADNLASKKIIENNGGVFEDAIDQEASNAKKLRFWISPP